MTGLPLLPTLPAAPPRSATATAAARAWLDAARAVSGAGADTVRALRVASGWSGDAADAATRRAAREQESCEEVAVSGLGHAASVAEWAAALQRLAVSRAELRRRVEELLARRRSLEPLPDDRTDAPALRRSIWRAREEISAGIDRWHSELDAAESAFVAALATAASPRTVLSALDAGNRALLVLDDSPAAEATRLALEDGVAAGRTPYLLAFDPSAFDDDGEVVIAYGDPTTADDIAVVVPGITNDGSHARAVGAMALAVAAAATATGTTRRTASVAWMGYDAPSAREGASTRGNLRDLSRTIGVAAAQDGADRLETFVGRLEATAPRAQVTVVGHSYGSTTAAIAARHGMPADRLVLLGSPGAGPHATRAADLHLPVHVASNDLDPVTWVGSGGATPGPGALGADPAQAAFGADRLPGNPTTAPRVDETTRFAAIHNDYLTPGSVTWAAVGDVVVGDQPAAVPGRTSGGAALATGWLADQMAEELTSWR